MYCCTPGIFSVSDWSLYCVTSPSITYNGAANATTDAEQNYIISCLKRLENALHYYRFRVLQRIFKQHQFSHKTKLALYALSLKSSPSSFICLVDEKYCFQITF